MKKFLIVTIVVIAVITASLAAFVKIYLTPERVKEFVIPTAGKSLNRQVNIDDLNISLLKGISLTGFAIKESDGQDDFVKCREFVLEFKLLPLLAKKVIIDEVRLVSPSVHIERGRDGKFNFEDIGEREEPEATEEGRKPDTEGKSGLPVALLVHNIEISDAKFSLTDLLNELPGIRSTANVDISIKSVDGSNIFTEGGVTVTMDEIVLNKPEKTIRDLNMNLDYALNVNIESTDIHIDRADMKIQDIPASIKGDIRNLRAEPAVDVALTIPGVNASEFQKLAALFADLKGLTLSGGFAADVTLQGRPEKPETLKASGRMHLDKTGIKKDEINAVLDGNITFDEKTMNIDLTGEIDRNTAEIKGTIKNYTEDQDINLNVYSKKLYLDELIPAGGPGPEARPEGGRPSPEKPSEEPEPFDLNLTANGEVRVDSAVFRNMEMTDFFMQYRFRENRLEIVKLTADAGKGTLDLKSLVDLSKKGYTYSLSTKADSLHAEEMVNSFVPDARDTVFGIITFNMKMSGAGTLPDNIKQNLIGGADFNIKDGRITGTSLTKELSRFLQIEELETIHLKKAEGTVRVKDRVARLDSLFTSDNLSLAPHGTIGLDETLDLAFDLRLSPRLTDKAMSEKVSKYIKTDEGWGTLPLLVKGTFSEPVYMIDLEKAGKRAIKKEADKYIDKLFEKEDEEKQKELEPVKDLLKGIFR